MASVPNNTAPGIEVGDVLGRFTILAQLGRGNFSSVWLAEHTVMGQDREANQLAVLKVLNASTSFTEIGPDFEQRLARKEIEALNTRHHFLLMPDDAIHKESTGHLGFLFTQLCGPSAFEYAIGCPDRRLPWTMAKRIITDTIAALHFLHEHGVGHGDLHTRNLLLVPQPCESFRNADTVLRYAQARIRIVKTAPAELTPPDIEVMTSFLEDQSITFTGAIKLADFGSGFLSAERATGKTRLDVKAPERLGDKTWALPADIWALGCTLLELVAGKRFVQGPAEIPWRGWTDKIFFGLVEKKLVNMEHEVTAFLREHASSDITNKERKTIEDLVIGMLRRRPEDRLEMNKIHTVWEAAQM